MFIGLCLNDEKCETTDFLCNPAEIHVLFCEHFPCIKKVSLEDAVLFDAALGYTSCFSILWENQNETMNLIIVWDAA